MKLATLFTTVLSAFTLVTVLLATSAEAAPPRSDETQVVRKGMSGEEVRARWGQPREIRPMESAEGAAEVWVFRRLIDKQARQTAVDTVDMPRFSLTAKDNTIWVPEPVYELETIHVFQEMHLLMFEGRVTAWKSFVERQRHFD